MGVRLSPAPIDRLVSHDKLRPRPRGNRRTVPHHIRHVTHEGEPSSVAALDDFGERRVPRGELPQPDRTSAITQLEESHVQSDTARRYRSRAPGAASI